MRIVVTGATGNVGTSLLELLGSEPGVDSVLGLARRPPSASSQPKIDWDGVDVTTSDLATRFRGADVVIHLAWVIQPSHHVEAMAAINVGGSARVLAAVAEAKVPALVYASSVGAYSPGPKDRRVDESWPTEGFPSSFYSRHKAAVERILDGFETEHPEVRVVRLRKGLVFKREAGERIRALFLGPLVPVGLLRASLIPVVPDTPGLAVQAVHTLDAAHAYRLAALQEARGAYNIVADPVLDVAELARLLSARPVPLPASALRAAAELTWRLRLQPTPPGWVDLALGAPLLDASRAHRELGWAPKISAGDALLDLLDGLRHGAGLPTPASAPRRQGWSHKLKSAAAARH
ncbi:MAG: NAD-dependent epimerase/dehydratase family protein [Actinobacteria bacterium]|nr:NAD-dependent epimerase/dehydratase family protein [Actinomycetota bacterium]